jgi:Right handed beta helix region
MPQITPINLSCAIGLGLARCRLPSRFARAGLLGLAFALGTIFLPDVMSAASGSSAVPAVLMNAEGKATVHVAGGDERNINAAIAALPAAGGVVTLGPGVFPLNRPVVIDRDGIELRGSDAGTVLRLAAGSNCPLVVIGSMATPTRHRVRHILVQRLELDGNRGQQSQECYQGGSGVRGSELIRNNCVTVRGAEDVQLADLVTSRARSGGVVLEKSCRRILVLRLESFDNEFDGLAAYETEDSIFLQLNLHDNRCAALSFDWRFNNNLVAMSELARNGSQGVFMRDSVGNRFERVLIRDNGAQGIFLAETPELAGTASRDNRFQAVTVTANKAQGVRINDATCTGNTLEGSRVSENGHDDISLAAAGMLQVMATVARRAVTIENGRRPGDALVEPASNQVPGTVAILLPEETP